MIEKIQLVLIDESGNAVVVPVEIKFLKSVRLARIEAHIALRANIDCARRKSREFVFTSDCGSI